MKKILILANSSNGLYGFRNELLVELLKEYELYLSLPDELNRKDLEEEGCHFVFTPINRRGINPLQDFKLFMTYLKILKRISPDVVLTYTIKPNIYGGLACRLRKINYITTITGLGTAFQGTGFIKAIVVFLYRMGVKRAKKVFFQNQANLEVFSKNKIIEERQSVLVPGSGVNTTLHHYLEYPNCRESRFLFVGRVMREKGIEEFLDAAKVLHSDTLFFEIVGDCDEDYEEKLLQLQEMGVIKWHNFQMEVDPFYRNASALVLPTYHEGMSNVLMEASSVGRPVLASNISGCREIFEEGKTGFGFLPKNSDDLIRVIRKFLTLSIEERKTMGYNARVKMKAEFEREKVLQAYLKQIRCLME